MTNVTEERADAASGVEHVKEQVQTVAAKATDQGRQQLQSQIQIRSTEFGDQIAAGARAMRQTGEQLRSEANPRAAAVLDAVADRGERLGDYLTRADSDEVLRDAEEFARRQPWLVFSGVAVLGFLAARFLKASSSGRYQASIGAGSRSTGGRSALPRSSDGEALAGSGAYRG